MPDCSVTGCVRRYLANGMCAMHYRRKARGKPSTDPVQGRATPFGQFVEACIALADAPAESDSAYDLAIDQARKAACTWMRSMGWAPTATERLAESVQGVIHAGVDGSGQQSSSARLQAGPLRQSGRDAGVGEGNPRARRQPLGSGADDAGGTDGPGQSGAGAVQGGGSDSGPGGTEADRDRLCDRGSVG